MPNPVPYQIRHPFTTARHPIRTTRQHKFSAVVTVALAIAAAAVGYQAVS